MKSKFAENLPNTNHEYKSQKGKLAVVEYLRKGEELNSKENLYIYLEHKKELQNIINTRIESIPI